MLARYAWLDASGAVAGGLSQSWAARVDRMVLFAPLNRGVDIGGGGHTYGLLGRTWADMLRGSAFVTETRVAWVNWFSTDSQRRPVGLTPPRVVQVWGTDDTRLWSESDNADLSAFTTPTLVRFAGVDNLNVVRLEAPFAADPVARWQLLRPHLLGDAQEAEAAPRLYRPRRLLFVARGIRDASFAGWTSELRKRAVAFYGEGNVEVIEYGWFSAAHFARPDQRRKLVSAFRDLYSQRLAENPLTEFDFIGHSNGTYMLAHALAESPSIRFRHVVLAAPVLPTDFDWATLFERGQVQKLRYDAASGDWAVAVLCQALRALGQTDVGRAGVVGFGEGNPADSRLQMVAWHSGSHDAALQFEPGGVQDNLQHLLQFAALGKDLGTAEPLAQELGALRWASGLTPYLVRLVVASFVGVLAWLLWRRRWRLAAATTVSAVGLGLLLYMLLDAG